MSNNVYVGRRYVPKFHTNEDGSSLWNKNKEYESLTIVTFEGNSYTSKKDVPSGVELNNKEYWVKSADYNEQLAVYRDEQTHLKSDFDNIKNNLVERVTNTENTVNSFTENINEKIKLYDTSISSINETLSDANNNINTLNNKVDTNSNKILSFDKEIKKVKDMSKIVSSANLIFYKNLPAKDTIWLQSFCINRTDNVMIACYSIDDTTSHIQKISLSDMSVLMEVGGLPYYHVNDVTYNSRTNEIILTPMNEPNAYNKLIILDYATLNKKREVLIGSDNGMSVYGISYDSIENVYYVAMNVIRKLDSNFNILEEYQLSYDYNANVFQTMEYYNNMLFIMYNNKIVVYDTTNKCEFIKSIAINNNVEGEGIALLEENTLLIGKIHSNFKETPKLYKLNLFDSVNNKKIFYNNLEDIGVIADENLSITTICRKMENFSSLSFDVNTYPNLTTLWTQIPNRYSCLDIERTVNARMLLRCHYWEKEKPRVFVATYRADKDDLPIFVEIGGNATTTQTATLEQGEQGTTVINVIKKRNGILTINVCVEGLTDFTGTKNVGVLPIGFRPPYYARVDGFTTGNGSCRFEITTEGKILMKTSTLTSPTNNDWFEFNATFIVA